MYQCVSVLVFCFWIDVFYLQWCPISFSFPESFSRSPGTLGHCPPQQKGSSPVECTHANTHIYFQVMHWLFNSAGLKSYHWLFWRKITWSKDLNVYMQNKCAEATDRWSRMLQFQLWTYPDFVIRHPVLCIIVELFLRVNIDAIGSQLFSNLHKTIHNHKQDECILGQNSDLSDAQCTLQVQCI